MQYGTPVTERQCQLYGKSARQWRNSLTIGMLHFDVVCQSALPLVSVCKKLLLVAQQLLSRLSAKLEIRPFHNSIDGAALLTEAAKDAPAVTPGESTHETRRWKGNEE